jgi:hypothetical protein
MSEANSLSGLLSVNGPSFELLGAYDFSDAIFLELVNYLTGTDRALSAKLNEIRQLEQTKEKLTKRIEYLEKALSLSKSTNDGQVVYVHGGITDPQDPSTSPYANNLDELHKKEKEYNDRLQEKWNHGESAKEIYDQAHAEHFYRKQTVKDNIEKARNQLEQLNSSSQILMIDLQRLLNQRNQAVEFTTNVIAKDERTARSIIENLKA